MSFWGCTHEPIIEPIKPTSSFVNVPIGCNNCTSSPICAIIDDIQVGSSTTYSICAANPAGQGSLILDQNYCILWTPKIDANQIVKTCIIACNGSICDTTFFTIFPPNTTDTTNTGKPCDPKVIYFEKDILPIITTNCAYSGCHNATSAEEGVVLDNYANIMKTGGINPGNPSKSELYEVITDKDQKDIMPPPPSPKLTDTQIQLIANWITQGAKNETCNENPSTCVTENVSYSKYVKEALASCTSCHNSGNLGGGVNLESYVGVKSAADNGKLLGAISWQSGYKSMPQGGSKLPDCTIRKIKSWIESGSPNN